MIQLSKNEKMLILACKGQLSDKYPYQGYWYKTLKPLFIEIYGWSPDEGNNYKDYLNCLFATLFDITMKINDDRYKTNLLTDIFHSSFEKTLSNDAELPIERTIHSLCNVIRFTQVMVNDTKRFDLTL